MKIWLIVVGLFSKCLLAQQWGSYEAFEVDVTNAMANVEILMSPAFTNRLEKCVRAYTTTNELASAALLTLAVCDDVKSDRLSEFVGDTNALIRATQLLSIPSTERNLWQKSCALAMLASSREDVNAARDDFISVTNVLRQWDSFANCYNGGAVYRSFAAHFGATELVPRSNILFAAAVSAKTAGMTDEYLYYKQQLPRETQIFLDD